MRAIKFWLLCLVIIAGTATAISQVPASLLEGEVSGFKNCTVTLFRSIKGVQQRTAESSLTKTGNRFSFAFPVSAEGEFVKLIISDFDKEGVKAKNRLNYNVELFIKHNDKLDVRVELQKTDLQPSFPKCTIIGKSPENEIMLGWQKMYQQFRTAFNDTDPGARVKKFTTAYGQYKPKLSGYIAGAVCKTNPNFEKTFREAASAKMKFAPIEFFANFQQDIEKADPNPAYQKLLKQAYADLQAYCGDALFRMEGINNQKRYYQLLYRMKSAASGQPASSRVNDDSVKALICNQTVKDIYDVQPGIALSAEVDTSKRVEFPKSSNDKRLAYVRVQLDGFKTTPDFKLTAFEKVSNRTLVAVRPTDNYLVVPVTLNGPTLLMFDMYDLKAKLYMNPGDSVDLQIYNASNDPSGQRTQARYNILQGSAENRMLASWYSFAYPVLTRYLQPSMVTLNATQVENFRKDYNRIQDGVPAFMAEHSQAGNADFQNMFRTLAAFDLRLSSLMLLAKMHTNAGYAGPFFKGFKAEKVPEFFKAFSDGKILCEPEIFRIPDADQLVNYISELQWALLPAAEKEKLPAGSGLGFRLQQLCSPEAKSCLLAWEMLVNEFSNWREVKLNLLPNKALFVTDEMRMSYDRLVNEFAADTQFIGRPIIDVPFADTSGRMIRFSDFKGKVVFIDVWATWCAPCRDQIPYLMKIEEEYVNNPDMVFFGLSVDREKDREKWKKFIATEKLHGIQIIDPSGKGFQKQYQITAIPRFILVDKDGNISEIRCPYPANGEELKKYLNELLAKPAHQ